jgi:hypothetical protein
MAGKSAYPSFPPSPASIPLMADAINRKGAKKVKKTAEKMATKKSYT